MTIRVSHVLIVLLFTGFLAFVYFQMEKNRQMGQQFNMEISELDMRVRQLDSKLNRAQERIKQLEKTSIKGVVENANDAILQGFGAMIGVMESELQKAKQRLSGGQPDDTGESGSESDGSDDPVVPPMDQ